MDEYYDPFFDSPHRRSDKKIRELRATGAFVDPWELQPKPRPKVSIREVDGCQFPVVEGMRNYFWPFLAWLKLRPLKTSLSYVSFLEQIDRNDALYFGLEAYVAWRPDAGAVLIGWVENANIADAMAELGHLEEVRERIYRRLRKLGPPHDELELGLIIASPALSHAEVANYVSLDHSDWVGPDDLQQLGERLEAAVASRPRGVDSVEHLMAASGVMFDHTFPAQALNALPSELFDASHGSEDQEVAA